MNETTRTASSSQSFVPHFALDRGMFATGSPQNQPDGTWQDSNGFRFSNGSVTQFPHMLKQLPIAPGDFTGLYPTIALLSNTASGGLGSELLYISGTFSNPAPHTDNVINFNPSTGFSTTIGSLVGTQYDPFYAVVVADAAYITSLANTVKRCDGATLTEAIKKSPNDPDPTATDSRWRYSAKYEETFYNHLVLAYVALQGATYPMRVAYSDIDDFSDFTPLDVNDADFFDLDQAGGMSLNGITGLKRLGELLAIYTTDEIWNMTYVGFANGVMSFVRQVSGIGCKFPNSVVVINRLHYFIGADDFYSYDGYFVRSIGAPIRKYFFDNVSVDPLSLPFCRGFAVPDHSEIWWTFSTNQLQSGSPVDIATNTIVFNYKENTWCRRDYNQGPLAAKYMLYDAVPVGTTFFRSMDSWIGTTFNGRAGTTFDGLSQYATTLAPSYAWGLGLAVEIPTGSANKIDTTILVSANGYSLTTGDFQLDDAQAVKQVSAVLIDAGQQTLSATVPAVDVYVAARRYVSDPVVFRKQGTFVFGAAAPDRLSFATTLAGRVFRYKFVWAGQNIGPVAEGGHSGLFFQQGADTYGATFNGFGETLYNVQQTN